MSFSTPGALGGFGQEPPERPGNSIRFHAAYREENNLGPWANQQIQGIPVAPVYCEYKCGECEKSTTGRVLCDLKRASDGAIVKWCLCACERKEPTVIVEAKNGMVSRQLPLPREFYPGQNWPDDIRFLYEEAALSFSAGAYTSSSLACRKLLMVFACHEQQAAGKPVKSRENFAYYVDYITNEIFSLPRAKAAIDAIRQIGNEATHEVTRVTRDDAERSLRIAHYILSTIYSLPLS